MAGGFGGFMNGVGQWWNNDVVHPVENFFHPQNPGPAPQQQQQQQRPMGQPSPIARPVQVNNPSMAQKPLPVNSPLQTAGSFTPKPLKINITTPQNQYKGYNVGGLNAQDKTMVQTLIDHGRPAADINKVIQDAKNAESSAGSAKTLGHIANGLSTAETVNVGGLNTLGNTVGNLIGSVIPLDGANLYSAKGRQQLGQNLKNDFTGKYGAGVVKNANQATQHVMTGHGNLSDIAKIAGTSINSGLGAASILPIGGAAKAVGTVAPKIAADIAENGAKSFATKIAQQGAKSIGEKASQIASVGAKQIAKSAVKTGLRGALGGTAVNTGNNVLNNLATKGNTGNIVNDVMQNLPSALITGGILGTATGIARAPIHALTTKNPTDTVQKSLDTIEAENKSAKPVRSRVQAAKNAAFQSIQKSIGLIRSGRYENNKFNQEAVTAKNGRRAANQLRNELGYDNVVGANNMVANKAIHALGKLVPESDSTVRDAIEQGKGVDVGHQAEKNLVDAINKQAGADSNYIQHEHIDKTNKTSKYLEGQTSSAIGKGMQGKTASRDHQTIDGNKVVFQERDASGKRTGRLVDENHNIISKDFSPKSAKSVQADMLRNLNRQLAKANKAARSTAAVKAKGGVSETRVNKVAGKINDGSNKLSALQQARTQVKGESQRLAREMAGDGTHISHKSGGPTVNGAAQKIGKYWRKKIDVSTKQNNRQLIINNARFDELQKVKPVTTNQDRLMSQHADRIAAIQAKIDAVNAKFAHTKSNDSVIKDTNGNIRVVRPSTAKEVEDQTGAHIDNNAARQQLLHLTRSANKAALDRSAEEIKSMPGLKQHMMKQTIEGEGNRVPKGWVSLDGIPQFKGYYADKHVAEVVKEHFGQPTEPSGASAALHALNNITYQALNLSPQVHMENRVAQAASYGSGGMKGLSSTKNLTNITRHAISHSDAAEHEAIANGVRPQAYGYHVGANIKNPFHLGAKVLSDFERNLRVGQYEAAKQQGMTARQAAVLDHKTYEGFSHGKDPTNGAGMYTGYLGNNFRILGNSVKDIAHGNLKPGLNLLTQQVAQNALNATAQGVTGNTNASVGAHGPIATLDKVIGDLSQGGAQNDLAALGRSTTGYISPALNLGADLISGHNAYGQPLNTPGAIGSDLMYHVPYGGDIMAITQGKDTPLTEMAKEGLQLKLPHAKGDVATTNPMLSGFNTPGAKQAPFGADKTGYQQEQAHFKMQDDAFKGLNPNSRQYSLLKEYFANNYTPDGQKISNGVVGGYQNAQNLLSDTSGVALKNLYNAEHAQANNDPLWSLPLNALAGQPSVRNYLTYEAKYEGPEKTGTKMKMQGTTGGQKGWIDSLATQRQNYFNTLGIKSTDLAANEPAYPQFDKQTQNDVNQAYSINNSKQYGQFLQSHPDVLDAQAATTQWQNQIRQLEGGPTIEQAAKASPKLQSIINYYNSLPPSKTAGNTDPNTMHMRSNWIKANPAMYAAMGQFYAQNDMLGVIKNGIEAAYSGQNLNDQTLLKDVKSGAGDIVQNANGTYSINAGAANAANSAAYSKYSKSYSKYSNPYAYENIYPNINYSGIGTALRDTTKKIGGNITPKFSTSRTSTFTGRVGSKMMHVSGGGKKLGATIRPGKTIGAGKAPKMDKIAHFHRAIPKVPTSGKMKRGAL